MTEEYRNYVSKAWYMIRAGMTRRAISVATATVTIILPLYYYLHVKPVMKMEIAQERVRILNGALIQHMLNGDGSDDFYQYVDLHIKDPWGNRHAVGPDGFMYSYGPDCKYGTEDDVTLTQNEKSELVRYLRHDTENDRT